MKLTLHTKETAPEESQAVIDEVINAYGFFPNLYAMMAAAPMAPRTYLDLNAILDKTSLSDTEVQIVLIATSYENECTYCVAAHTVVAGMKKVPNDIVQALRDGTQIADPKLEALRALTASIVQTRGRPTPKILKAFADAGYMQAQLIEVLIGVATKTFTNYLNHISDTPLDEVFKTAEWKKETKT